MRKRIGITAGVSLLLCFSITFPSVASENEVSGYSRNISGIQMESENYDETVEDSYNCEDELVKILENIEPDLRLTVTLYYYDELSIKEISKVLNIPEGTVKSRLARARGKLYDILKGGEESGQK